MNKNKLLGGFCAVNMLVLPQIVVKAQQSTAVNDKKTNIIFILADDMGYCDLTCYGNKYIENKFSFSLCIDDGAEYRKHYHS